MRTALSPLRPLLPAAVMVRRLWRRVARPRLRGVRVAATDEAGRWLLIRHTYGDTARWRWPGGGVKRGEGLKAAAARELREEAGVRATELRMFGQYRASADGVTHIVTMFTARAEGTPRGDGFEVADARFWSPDALPPLTPATTRRLEEIGGQRATAEWW